MNPSASLLTPASATEASLPTMLNVRPSLVDAMYDGFYLLFLLKNGYAPQSAEKFSAQITDFLNDFERRAKKEQIKHEEIHAAKYAFCAAIDEAVLSSQLPIRNEWGRKPLQLSLFGDQLAGEHFFSRLEEMRGRIDNLQALEVFHMCLLLGFKGKYLLEGAEKLAYLTARLGEEIANMKGKRIGFAPHWALPDSVMNVLKRDVPLWVIGAVFGLFALLAFVGFKTYLGNNIDLQLAQYVDIVKLAAKVASLNITLP